MLLNQGCRVDISDINHIFKKNLIEHSCEKITCLSLPSKRRNVNFKGIGIKTTWKNWKQKIF